MTGDEMERAIQFLVAQSVSRLEEQTEINRDETRDAINRLLLGNEVTRSLAQDVARLAIATSNGH